MVVVSISSEMVRGDCEGRENAGSLLVSGTVSMGGVVIGAEGLEAVSKRGEKY